MTANYINKPTRCTFCMYLFYNFCTILHVSNDHFVHHQEFMIYCICSCVQTMQTCLDTFAWFVHSYRYSKSWTAYGERNGRSKHVELYKNCRINTYRKCILLVCLSNSYAMYNKFEVGIQSDKAWNSGSLALKYLHPKWKETNFKTRVDY